MQRFLRCLLWGQYSKRCAAAPGSGHCIAEKSACLVPLLRRAAALPGDELMRHDDLCGQKVRVLNVVDGLAGGLHAQLVGVHVHGGQLRAGDAGEQRVVEGHDGEYRLGSHQ